MITPEKAIEFMDSNDIALADTINHGESGWVTLLFDNGFVINSYPNKDAILTGKPGLELNSLKIEWRKFVESNKGE